MKKELSIAGVEALLAKIKEFPKSTNEATVQYDTGKLINILREKEVLEICQVDKSGFDLVNDIDIRLGKVVRDLVFQVDLEKSLEEYRALEKEIEETTTGNLYIYAKQGALSVISLYHYKKGNWDKAIDYTVECVALNDYLIQKGMYSLNLRVFEQNKNISRVLFRAQKHPEGFKLLNDLFHYMLTSENRGLHGGTLLHKMYWEKMPVIRETYTYEMFCMIVEDMIWFNQKSDEFFPNDWCKDLTFEVDNPNRQVLYNYMFMINQLKEGDFEGFMESFVFYFNEPISLYYDILKLSLMLEANKLIRNTMPSVIQDKATAIIGEYVMNKLEVSDRLKEMASVSYLSISVPSK